MKRMTYVHPLLCAGLLLQLLLSAGCQNMLTIRVERVVGVSSVSPNSRLGSRLDTSIKYLNELIDHCISAEGHFSQFVDQFEPRDRPQARTALKYLSSIVVKTKEEAMRLRDECAAYFGPSAHAPRPRAARQTLQEVRRFSERAAADLRGLARTLDESPALYALAQGLVNEKLEALKAPAMDLTPEDKRRAAEEARGPIKRAIEGPFNRGIEDAALAQAAAGDTGTAATVQFGGFVSNDAYMINPSDPKYAEVLDKERRFGVEPITQASIGVTGDSALMAVMEHPGQVRVYQISMDPTQFVRNIALLISKATQAAAKFAPLL